MTSKYTKYFCLSDLWKKEGTEACLRQACPPCPLSPRTKIASTWNKNFSLVCVGWGGVGGRLTLTFKKKIKTTPPSPPPRKQIREFWVPIIDFTCHQIIGFSGSIFSAKKKTTLGGCGFRGVWKIYSFPAPKNNKGKEI